MSIEDANSLLWQQGIVPTNAFSIFKRTILHELATRNGLTVGRTGKKGKSVKTNYIEALSNLVSELVLE